jgi:Xaa-Pro aminopeptidase
MGQQPHHQVSLPAVEGAEYVSRRRALSNAVAELGTDGWVAFGDDGRFGGPNHIRYLTGFDPHFEPVFLAMRGERACLLSGAETKGLAGLCPFLVDPVEIEAIRELAYPGLEYTTIELVDGVELMREIFAGLETVALVGVSAVRSADHAAIIDPLSETFHTRPADDIAFRLRAQKSEAEHRAIDYAYAIAALGMAAAMHSLAPGVAEREVAAEAEYAMRKAGAENFAFDTMVGSGPNSSTILTRSTGKPIAAGEMVTITLAPRYDGYGVSFSRPFVLGTPPAALAVAVETGWRAFEAAAELLRPGLTGADATRAARDTVRAGSLGAAVEDVWVHSMGVIEFEPPFFDPTSAATIEAGMALSIDVPLFHAPWGGFRIEDGYEIIETGARPRTANARGTFPFRL